MGTVRLSDVAKALPRVLSDLFSPIAVAAVRPFAPVCNFSVIIPTFNESENIAGSIQSLRKAPLIADIIVADGGSSDDTRSIAAGLDARVIQGKKGRGCQIHAGIRHCQGEVILILHADCLMVSGMFDRILALLNKDSKLIGGALGMRFEGGDARARLVSALNNIRARYFGISFGDQCQFFRKEGLSLIGGFPDQMLMEDVELSLRLKAQGAVCYIPDGVVVSSRRWERTGFAHNVGKVLTLFLTYLVKRRAGADDLGGEADYARYYGKGDF